MKTSFLRFCPRGAARLALVALAFAALTGCRSSLDTPQGTVERFLDTHYVLIDLDASRELCIGLAQVKLAKEIELTKDQAIDADTFKPSISYRQKFADESGADAAKYEYELQISAPGAAPFPKRVLVSLRREAGVWKVSNYSESDVR